MRHSKSLIVAGVAVVTLGLTALDRTHFSFEEAPVAASAALAPDVTFILLDGQPLKLRSLKGHTVLLHFWASWCAPCRVEFGDLLQRVKASDDTILLAVSADAHAEDVRTFLEPYRHDFAALFDSGRVRVALDSDRHLIEGAFQTFQYPETIVIGPDLTMRHKIAGIYHE